MEHSAKPIFYTLILHFLCFFLKIVDSQQLKAVASEHINVIHPADLGIVEEDNVFSSSSNEPVFTGRRRRYSTRPLRRRARDGNSSRFKGPNSRQSAHLPQLSPKLVEVTQHSYKEPPKGEGVIIEPVVKNALERLNHEERQRAAYLPQYTQQQFLEHQRALFHNQRQNLDQRFLINNAQYPLDEYSLNEAYHPYIGNLGNLQNLRDYQGRIPAREQRHYRHRDHFEQLHQPEITIEKAVIDYRDEQRSILPSLVKIPTTKKPAIRQPITPPASLIPDRSKYRNIIPDNIGERQQVPFYNGLSQSNSRRFNHLRPTYNSGLRKGVRESPLVYQTVEPITTTAPPTSIDPSFNRQFTNGHSTPAPNPLVLQYENLPYHFQLEENPYQDASNYPFVYEDYRIPQFLPQFLPYSGELNNIYGGQADLSGRYLGKALDDGSDADKLEGHFKEIEDYNYVDDYVTDVDRGSLRNENAILSTISAFSQNIIPNQDEFEKQSITEASVVSYTKAPSLVDDKRKQKRRRRLGDKARGRLLRRLKNKRARDKPDSIPLKPHVVNLPQDQFKYTPTPPSKYNDVQDYIYEDDLNDDRFNQESLNSIGNTFQLESPLEAPIPPPLHPTRPPPSPNNPPRYDNDQQSQSAFRFRPELPQHPPKIYKEEEEFPKLEFPFSTSIVSGLPFLIRGHESLGPHIVIQQI